MRDVTSLNDDQRKLLGIVLDKGGVTRAAVAAETGWARGTVTQRITELTDAQWLTTEQLGSEAEQRGRPSTIYRINRDAGIFFVMSYGQTQVTVALVDLLGTPLAARSIAFAPEEEIERAEHVAHSASSILDDLLRDSNRRRHQVKLCIVGKPGPVDPDDPDAPTAMPGWLGSDVRDVVEDALSIPTFIDNDVNLMALGWWDHQQRPDGIIVFVKVALGLGAGIIIDGELIRGRRGMAGEIGHLPVSGSSSTRCACGQFNCAAQLAGARPLLAELRSQGLDVNTIDDLASLTARGDSTAIAALRQAGRYVGEALLGVVATLAPDIITIGGPLATLGDHLVTGARESLYARSIPSLTAGMRVIPTPNHRTLSLRGAAVVGIQRLMEDGVLASVDQTSAA